MNASSFITRQLLTNRLTVNVAGNNKSNPDKTFRDKTNFANSAISLLFSLPRKFQYVTVYFCHEGMQRTRYKFLSLLLTHTTTPSYPKLLCQITCVNPSSFAFIQEIYCSIKKMLDYLRNKVAEILTNKNFLNLFHILSYEDI